MIILFFTRLFYPHIGGVETHIMEVGERLVKMGNRVIVVTEEIRGQSQALSKDSSNKVHEMEIHRIPVGKEDRLKKFRIWYWLWQNKSLIKSADIVHCHDVFFWYLPFRFLFSGKKVYTTFHGYETKFPPSRKAIIVRKISEKLSRGNICVGKYIEKWYGTKANYITYGGVNKVKSEKLKVKSYSSKLKILFIGRLEKDIGIPIYLATLNRLKQKNIKYEFVAAGDGSLRKEAEKFGKVEGFIQETETFIKDSDIVFASSYLSILQSLASKKIVVSVYDNPLKKDYLQDSPFSKYILVQNYAEDLVNSIEQAMKNHQETEKIIIEGSMWARTQTWERVVEIYLALWNKKQIFL